MMLIAMLLAAAVTDDAPRRTDIDVASERSLIDLQTCVTRRLSMHGYVTPLPIDNGVALDWGGNTNLIGLRGKAPLAIEIRDAGDARHITAAYRHPWSAKAARNMTKDLAKRCFPEAPPLGKE